MMSKIVGQVKRKHKLGLFYIERDEGDRVFSFRGLIRGWAAENWNGTSGQPLFYAFSLSKDVETGKEEVKLLVMQFDMHFRELELGERKDLRRGIHWYCSKYWARNATDIHEVPVADLLLQATVAAMRLFNPKVQKSIDFEDTWIEDWRIAFEKELQRKYVKRSFF